MGTMPSMEERESAVATDAEDTLPFVKSGSKTGSLSSYMTCDEENTARPTYDNGTGHPRDDDDTTTDGSYVTCVDGVIGGPRSPSTPTITVMRPDSEATFLQLSPTRREEARSVGDAEPPGAG